MRFCLPHWQELREAILAQGLESLIAKDGEEIAARLHSELEEGAKKTNFDPLMAAHMAILSNALSVAGLVVMSPNEDGSERCPLCYLVGNCPCGRGNECPYRTWIYRAAEDMRTEAIKLGLLSSG